MVSQSALLGCHFQTLQQLFGVTISTPMFSLSNLTTIIWCHNQHSYVFTFKPYNNYLVSQSALLCFHFQTLQQLFGVTISTPMFSRSNLATIIWCHNQHSYVVTFKPCNNYLVSQSALLGCHFQFLPHGVGVTISTPRLSFSNLTTKSWVSQSALLCCHFQTLQQLFGVTISTPMLSLSNLTTII